MKIIIAGAGKIGRSVARSLALEGHDVTIIDSEPDTIASISNELDVICIEGSATNSETLAEAGASEADLLVAATGSDEINMVCGISAHKLGAAHVIARVRDPQYMQQKEFLREALGLSVIVNPEYECAQEISRILRFPSAVRVDSFSKGSLEIVEHRVQAGSVLDGLALRELPSKIKAKVLVSLVERGHEVIIPNGSFVIKADDMLSITASAKELRRFFIAIGSYKKPVKNVMIMGGSRIGVYLARLLHENGMDITIIEHSRERCEELCDLVPETNIVCGDASRSDVLLEEGLRSADAFIALTGEDGDNIITSLYAQRSGIGKIVTKVNRESFSEILEAAGLDSVVNAKEVVAEQITSYVRGLHNSIDSGTVETLYKLADGSAEALEFRVSSGAKCLGIKLRDMKLKQNVLIAALIRGSESIIPDGSTEIMAGDHAVVVAPTGLLTDVDSILK